MSVRLTGMLRVHANEMLEGLKKSRARARQQLKEVTKAVGLLRQAQAEILDLQRSLEGSRAYAALLEKRLRELGVQI